jgi:nicotinamide-nucleotide amidase
MRVEVINTGTEILLGNVVNSHLTFLAQQLFPLGLRIGRQVTVPDGDDIRAALGEAMARAEIVFVTGGLGPTTDDITREITAEMLGLDLELDRAVLKSIEERFARRNAVVTERVQRQAQVPRGARVLPNEHGTAPGLYLQTGSSAHLFLLPGPPRELEPMFFASVLPFLKQIVPERADLDMRTWRITGMGESNVEAEVGADLLAIDGLELGYCARPGEVDLRCIGAPAALELADQIVRSKLPSHISSDTGEPLEEVVIHRLAALGKTLAVAESCTGGFVAHRLTDVPGASAVFREGFVTYANEAKQRALRIEHELISNHGAVSHEVAVAMAENARSISGTDFALATTGIAGPGGGTENKPVGTVYIALAVRDTKSIVERHTFATDRETFKVLTSQAALDLLRRALVTSAAG